MLRQATKVMAMAVVAVALWGTPQAHAVPDQAGARAFMVELGQRAIQVLQQPGHNQEATVAAFRTLFQSSFDTATIGRFALGRYWQQATPEEQQEYLRLFQEMIVQTYARRFSGYSGEIFQVGNTQPVSDHDVMVDTQIIREGAPPIPAQWRLRERDGRFQVIDVVVEGVSMTVTQRNEFASVIQRGGGHVEALIQALRNQIAQAQRGS